LCDTDANLLIALTKLIGTMNSEEQAALLAKLAAK
jgi:hypothetical protein